MRMPTAIAALLLVVAAPAAAENQKVMPFDEASHKEGFLAFRIAFLKAVRDRDLSAVLDATAKDVKVWNDTDAGGIATLERQLTQGWSGSDADAYWNQLETTLELGGGFLPDGSFCAPYVYVAASAEASSGSTPSTGSAPAAAFSEAFVIRANAKLYSRPVEDSPVIGRLSYVVAPIAEWVDRDWIKIGLANGGVGYLNHRDFRIKGDYHVCFRPEPEGWRMTVFNVGE